MADRPIIDTEKCDGCGICVTVCACKALALVDNVATFVKTDIRKDCNIWCTQCEIVCPKGAITCPFDIVIEE